jgi:hypothetical protein
LLHLIWINDIASKEYKPIKKEVIMKDFIRVISNEEWERSVTIDLRLIQILRSYYEERNCELCGMGDYYEDSITYFINKSDGEEEAYGVNFEVIENNEPVIDWDTLYQIPEEEAEEMNFVSWELIWNGQNSQ